MNSTLVYYNGIIIESSTLEFISTLFSLLLLIIIISPALIILLDLDLIIIPSYIIYALGLQWAWQFNLVFLSISLNNIIGYSSYCDHYVISIQQQHINLNIITARYLIDISQYILLPIYSFIRPFVYPFDVIHNLGFYSWGIKIDAIPGRINLANSLRLLNKGEYRGKCFELCGQGHLAIPNCSCVIVIFSLIIYLLWMISDKSTYWITCNRSKSHSSNVIFSLQKEPFN